MVQRGAEAPSPDDEQEIEMSNVLTPIARAYSAWQRAHVRNRAIMELEKMRQAGYCDLGIEPGRIDDAVDGLVARSLR